MALSKVRLIRQLHDEDAAQEYLEYVKKDFPDQVASALPRLKEALHTTERLCWGGADDGYCAPPRRSPVVTSIS